MVLEQSRVIGNAFCKIHVIQYQITNHNKTCPICTQERNIKKSLENIKKIKEANVKAADSMLTFGKEEQMETDIVEKLEFGCPFKPATIGEKDPEKAELIMQEAADEIKELRRKVISIAFESSQSASAARIAELEAKVQGLTGLLQTASDQLHRYSQDNKHAEVNKLVAKIAKLEAENERLKLINEGMYARNDGMHKQLADLTTDCKAMAEAVIKARSTDFLACIIAAKYREGK